MKKILIVTNLILLSLLLFSYSEKKTEQSGLLDHDMKLGVDPKLSKDMLTNYKSNVWNPRKIENKNYLDARSVWFSLKKLKLFISDIESTTSQANCVSTDSFNLGIRIYFAAYPKNAWDDYPAYVNDHMLPSAYKGLHTVLMVPTLWNPIDSFYYDFDPRQIQYTNTGCSGKPMMEVMEALINPSGLGNGGRATPPVQVSPPVTSEIPRDKAYMIIPDNLDNRRFIPNSVNNTASNTKNKNNLLPTTTSASTTDANLANAGTLVPPPYPPQTGEYRVAARSIRYYIPYSGASFMRWVDETNTCGWNSSPYNSTDKINKSTIPKAQ